MPTEVNRKHLKEFKPKGLFGGKPFSVEIVMNTNVIYPTLKNFFQLKVDNTKVSQVITSCRLSLVRSVTGGLGLKEHITVENEEIANATYGGGPNNQVF